MKKIFSAIIVFLFTVLSSNATHIIGGDLSYRCLGSKTYEFTLTVYTECGSLAVLEKFYPISYYSVSQGIPQAIPKSFIVSQVSSTEEIIFCPTVTTNCNLGAARGIKKVIYKGNVNLSTYAFATDWNFYWRKAARSEEITTLTLPADQDFFLQVTMNNVAADCNNSPVFQNNPVIVACKDEVKTFNHIAIDNDGDVLVYSLVSPQSDLGVNVIYETGYGFTNFVSLTAAANINSTTGDITFTPTVKDQVGITDVLVKEYRGGVLIGSVVRGMQITIQDCTNEIPTLSDFIDINDDSIAVCSGSAINMFVQGADADGTQALNMTLAKGKANIFSVTNNSSALPKGRFSWTPLASDVGKHLFTVEVKDNGCPRPQTITRTYIIQVLPKPVVNLGADIVVKCGDPSVRITPTVTGGSGGYTYAWSTGETTSSILAAEGNYSLTVTDSKGCSASDAINLNNGLYPGFSASPRLVNQPTNFTDNSFSNNGIINSWSWKFGDGTTAIGQNTTHTYTIPGTYDVELTIKTDKNCSVSFKKKVVICAPPVVKFNNLDSCSNGNNPIGFEDLTTTPTECEIIKREWDWGDGSISIYTPPFQQLDYHAYNSGGNVNVKLTVTSSSGAVSFFTKTIHINESPVVIIKENDYYIKCNAPDTTLHSQVVIPGSGVLQYMWSTGETTKDIKINETGTYYLTVTDEKGCESFAQVTVSYPLYADFSFTPMCKFGDQINFTNETFNYSNNSNMTYTWDFGDGTPKSNQVNPVHTYSSLGDYFVKLDVKNNLDGCTSSFNHYVYNTYLKDTFSVYPKLITICVRDTVRGYGPEIDAVHGSHINSYEWDFGDGQKAYNRTPYVFYYAPGKYIVTLKVTYNVQPGMNSGCTKYYKDSVTVFPELRVDFDAFRVCTLDPVQLSFRRTAGDLKTPIVAASWEITNKKTGKKDFLPDRNPIYTFKERQTYAVKVFVKDSVGCLFSLSKDFFADEVAVPEFKADSICEQEFTNFVSDFKDQFENITQLYWDFGNNDTVSNYFSRPNFQKKKYIGAGTYPVTLKAYNSTLKCSQTITKYVKVKDRPVANFKADTVCSNQWMTFTNLSTIASGEAMLWRWDFGDGGTSEEKDPRHSYKTHGIYTVKLNAVCVNGCSDYSEHQVYVKETPKADFSIEEPLLEAFKILHFRDESEGNIIAHYWIFGDGATSTEEDPAHQYDTIKLYKVTHMITNEYGCMDTITKKTNLNVKLELPSAFSPNDDGTNDGIYLLHNGIKTLYEFKIFNRWGELVFDGGSNLDAVWDGTFRGKPQDAGVYIAYVKALGVYDTSFNFKKSINLIK